VTLYLDTQVIPSTVSWDSATRRIVIRPIGPLALNRTHTVRLEPELATAGGGRLGEAYFWQFKTVGVRPPDAPFPPDGTVDESPFVTLTWSGGQTTGDEVQYLVYAGEDSSAIAARSYLAAYDTTTAPYTVPSSRWKRGTPYYWAVRAYNTKSGDVSEGPVWRFDTVPAGAPVDSAGFPLSDWTSYDILMDNTLCFDSSFPVGRVLSSSFEDVKTVFYDDRLTAYIEAGLRHPGFHGFVFTGDQQSTLTTTGTRLVVHYFRE
jgi:hypothetical protein